MLWEILGLGAGSMPLTLRFSPPIGGVLYWLRPGTVRLPPWPDRVPLTRGTTAHAARRRALRRACSRSRLYLLVASGGRRGRAAPTAEPPRPGRGRGAARRCSALLGLRDKVPFLGGAAGDLRQPADRLPLPARATWIVACAVRLHLHLVGRRVLEAEPPLPLRRLGDDQQHAAGTAREGAEARGSTRDHPEDLLPSRLAGRRPPTSARCMEFTLPLLLLSSTTAGRSARSRSPG